jgi:hypothetical protein
VTQLRGRAARPAGRARARWQRGLRRAGQQQRLRRLRASRSGWRSGPCSRSQPPRSPLVASGETRMIKGAHSRSLRRSKNMLSSFARGGAGAAGGGRARAGHHRRARWALRVRARVGRFLAAPRVHAAATAHSWGVLTSARHSRGACRAASGCAQCARAAASLVTWGWSLGRKAVRRLTGAARRGAAGRASGAYETEINRGQRAPRGGAASAARGGGARSTQQNRAERRTRKARACACGAAAEVVAAGDGRQMRRGQRDGVGSDRLALCASSTRWRPRVPRYPRRWPVPPTAAREQHAQSSAPTRESDTEA